MLLVETLLVLTVALSLGVVVFKDLFKAVFLLAFADLLLAAVFYFLAAPDIALTQVSVVAALSTMLLVIAIHKTERFEK